jgi:predicted hotdog family 3-hydroxylacyl-ACP dehydratase
VQGKPRRGLLASLREVVCRRQRLDDLAGELVVEAAREAGDGGRVIYSFHVRVGETEVLSGRAAVVLDANPAADERR